jgi:hypothetical protein
MIICQRRGMLQPQKYKYVRQVGPRRKGGLDQNIKGGPREMITSCAFGRMEVDGREYGKDLIILPDGTIHFPWWRKSGHRLSLDDLGPVLETAPKILVVGTGAYGLMKPEDGLSEALAEKRISVKVLISKKAVAEFNALLAQGEQVAACFHLTC